MGTMMSGLALLGWTCLMLFAGSVFGYAIKNKELELRGKALDARELALRQIEEHYRETGRNAYGTPQVHEFPGFYEKGDDDGD